MRSPAPRPKKSGKSTTLNVTLVYKKKLLCSNSFDSEEHNTTDVLEYAMQAFRSNVSENVLGVECGNSELDYYLQCPKRSLDVFKTAVTLTPFVESP